MHDDRAAGDPWSTFARACLQLFLLGSAPSSSAARAADALAFRSMALAALRSDPPSGSGSGGSRPFVYGMRPFVDVGVTLTSTPRPAPEHDAAADAAAGTTRGGASGDTSSGTFFVGDVVTCACALESKAGLPIPRGTFAMRFVRAASGDAARAAERAAVASKGRSRASKHASARAGNNKRRSPLRNVFDSDADSAVTLAIVEEEAEEADGVSPDDWAHGRDLPADECALLFAPRAPGDAPPGAADLGADLGADLVGTPHPPVLTNSPTTAELVGTCTETGSFVFDRCWFTVGTMTMLLRRRDAPAALREMCIVVSDKPLDANVTLTLPPFAPPDAPTTCIVRIAARAALPRCTVRFIGALLCDAPSARLAGEAAPLIAVHSDRSGVLGIGAAREDLVFIAPPVEAGALLEVTFRTVARVPPPPPPEIIERTTFRGISTNECHSMGCAPPLMGIAVCVESTAEDSSRSSVTVRGELPVVVPFALVERSFAVPGRTAAPGGAGDAEHASSFEVARYVQCRIECTAPCALTALSYSLTLPNSTTTRVGSESAPPLGGSVGAAIAGAAAAPSPPEPLQLEPGQQIHAAFRVVAAR